MVPSLGFAWSPRFAQLAKGVRHAHMYVVGVATLADGCTGYHGAGMSAALVAWTLSSCGVYGLGFRVSPCSYARSSQTEMVKSIEHRPRPRQRLVV